ncbi:hypothetical protein LCGC14_1309910 [marine sediment metagenome]|uniref:Uncharacterized protein n=1 Tax=marine sediment metagenome TaxID=412755 RepID=A0A0F9N3X1_9ZZZZ
MAVRIAPGTQLYTVPAGPGQGIVVCSKLMKFIGGDTRHLVGKWI